MNLDEVIKYLEEMVEIGETYEVGKIVEEHRQLAEWLKELKDYRKTWDEVQKEIYRQIDVLDEMHEFRDKEAYFKALDIVNKYLKEVEHGSD